MEVTRLVANVYFNEFKFEIHQEKSDFKLLIYSKYHVLVEEYMAETDEYLYNLAMSDFGVPLDMWDKK